MTTHQHVSSQNMRFSSTLTFLTSGIYTTSQAYHVYCACNEYMCMYLESGLQILNDIFLIFACYVHSARCSILHEIDA